MKTILIDYGISWGILLLVYLYFIFVKRKSLYSNNWPWYLNAIIIVVFAPSFVLIVPFTLIEDALKNKKHKKWLKKEQDKQRIVEIHCKEDVIKYKSGSKTSISDQAVIIGRFLKHIVLQNDYDYLLSCLDKLELPTGYILKIRFAESEGLGDKSSLYISGPFGTKHENIFNYFKVEDSPIGAFQVYLIYKIWHYLPLFWHANCSSRNYVYKHEDLYDIGMYHNEEKAQTIKTLLNYDITPEIIHNEEKYYVSCCYWSDFGGLIREHVEIEIKDNKVINILDANENVLYEYNCGIIF